MKKVKRIRLCFVTMDVFRLTTGIDDVADGLHLRRRPKVGAVRVGGLQATQRRRPSAYWNPRRRPWYADGHPRRISAVGVSGGHVALMVTCIPAQSRRHISAEGGRRRTLAVGICGGYAEGGRRRIASIKFKITICIIFVVIYLLLSII
jgi:hypothetical protein